MLFLAGAGLLVALIAETDLQRVWARVRSAGWWFAGAFTAYVATIAAATAAWRALLLDTDARVSAPRLFAAAWCGESVNFVLPGGVPGEVAKGMLLRGQVAGSELAMSLAVYNWLTAVVIFVTVMIASAYALCCSQLPEAVAVVCFVSGALLALGTAALRLTLRRRTLQPLFELVQRVPLVELDAERASARVLDLDQRLRRVWQRYPRRFAHALGAMIAARVCAFAEVYMLLAGLLPDFGAAERTDLALLVQAATQLVLYVSVFVPGQLGAMEGGSAALFALLGIGSWVGLGMELCRRARKLLAIAIAAVFWLVLRRRPARCAQSQRARSACAGER